MTWEGYDETSDVRVVHQGEAAEVAYLQQRDRSKWQKLQDGALDDITDLLTDALAGIEEALEGLVMLGIVPQHRNLPTLIGQQIAQVGEVRRVRQ